MRSSPTDRLFERKMLGQVFPYKLHEACKFEEYIDEQGFTEIHDKVLHLTSKGLADAIGRHS